MIVTLSIIRYRKRFIFFGFMAMALHRIPLSTNRNISFYKLLGSGRNGTFDKVPDLLQWGILTVQDNSANVPARSLKQWYGTFISGWYKLFGCEVWTILLEPLEGHGSWDNKKVFGDLGRQESEYDGTIAILTRAAIRMHKLKDFWKYVAPVTHQMKQAPGFIMSLGIGELPWIKQATFSVWESKAAMRTFAYGSAEHVEVIRRTREEHWYTENMFVRFRIINSMGTIKGVDPLAGKQ